MRRQQKRGRAAGGGQAEGEAKFSSYDVVNHGLASGAAVG